MEKNKKIYFASDLHLGFPSYRESRAREKNFVRWLEDIAADAGEIILLGDVFDFWHEYKHVVPRGFTRFLGKISELTDKGIPVHYFTGNHDIWVYDYLPEETGMILHREAVTRDFNGHSFYLAHGDGLGPGDHAYKLLKKIFTSKVLQWLFARIHPNFALWMGNKWSVSNRAIKGVATEYQGKEGELLYQYAQAIEEKQHHDYYVFGHRHIPLELNLDNTAKVINLGDWIVNFTYGVFDGNIFSLKRFDYKKEA